MAINFSKLAYFQNITSNDIPRTPQKWLNELNSPTIIDFKKEGCERWRVITTLLHGNEPSGFLALHEWIMQGYQQDIAVNIRFIICSVEAAKFEPVFTNRFLAGGRDINRCFGVKSLADYFLRAELVSSCIRQVKPEAIIDLHNTSGEGPAFGVSCKEDKEHLAIATLFCDKVIISHLRIGALMEQDFSCSILAIECGGATDKTAHTIALDGLSQFCTKENILMSDIDQQIEVLHQPVRFKIEHNVDLSYQDKAPTSGVSLKANIESFNYGTTPAGTVFGWVDERGLDNFSIEDEELHGKVEDYFTIDNNALVSLKDLSIFMATTNPTIAIHDCLFYFINDKT